MNSSPGRPIGVLVVDDSALVRRLLSEVIAAQPDMQVIGNAADAFAARDKILQLQPDVITLDIEMPRMDGVTFLKKLMRFHPLPVLVISSLAKSSCETALDALRCGAVEVLAKPAGPSSMAELAQLLPAKIRAAAAARVRPTSPKTCAEPSSATPSFHDGVLIALGASTGGTEALRQVLMHFPANCPPILIAQHIPPMFSSSFAARLDRLCALEVKEAQDGDEVKPGRALVAPGNFHMLLRREGDRYRVQVRSGPQVCYQRPSVDVLFTSVAAAAGRNACAVLLTGMGSDGAQGMLRLKEAGALTIAQNEQTCVVYGMPGEAVSIGAVDRILPLGEIAPALLAHCAGCESKNRRVANA